MSNPFESARISILDSQEHIFRTGFLMANNLAVTCIHVAQSYHAGLGDSMQFILCSIDDYFLVGFQASIGCRNEELNQALNRSEQLRYADTGR